MNLPAVPDPADFDRGPLRYQLLPPLTADERESLRQSIEAVGVLQPVVVDEAGAIIDGHHRAEDRGGAGPVLPKQNPGRPYRGREAGNGAGAKPGPPPPRHREAGLVLELRRRGLSQRWISERTGIPKSTVARQAGGAANGAPDRVTGLDGKSYVAVRRPAPALHDEYDQARRLADDMPHWARRCSVELGPSPEERFDLATNVAHRVAARELLRTGQCPTRPCGGWPKCTVGTAKLWRPSKGH